MYLRHLTEEELVVMILAGIAQKFEVPWDSPSFPEWWVEDASIEQYNGMGGGVYLCTCGGEYNWNGN